MDNNESFQLKGMRISLAVKAVVAVWAFVIAVQSDDRSISMLYLFICIVFAGFFIAQLAYYRKKKKEHGQE